MTVPPSYAQKAVEGGERVLSVPVQAGEPAASRKVGRRVNEAKRARRNSVDSQKAPARSAGVAASPGLPLSALSPREPGGAQKPWANGDHALRAAEAPEGRGQRPAGRGREELRGLEGSAKTEAGGGRERRTGSGSRERALFPAQPEKAA